MLYPLSYEGSRAFASFGSLSDALKRQIRLIHFNCQGVRGGLVSRSDLLQDAISLTWKHGRNKGG